MADWTPDKTRAAAAKAWSELAHVLMLDYLRGWNNATYENVKLAQEALNKADAIDRSVALAHVARAKIREVEGDLEGEIKALDDALKFDPDLADAYPHKANAYILLGQAEKAPELLTKAIRLSPGDPELGLCYWFKGRAYFHMKDYDPAIHWLKKSVDVRPTTWFTWAHLISAYALTGRLGEPEAQAAVNKYRRRFLTAWPLEEIRKYYTQRKYRRALPPLQEAQRQAALEEYLKGLQIAHGTVGVEVP